jgi:hypothetical protein
MIAAKKGHDSPPPLGRSLPVKAASMLFRSVVKVRNALYDSLPFLSYPADRPVISVGGLRAGGTGKTPVALMVGEHLASQGRTVAFLSRGYRRQGRSLRIVNGPLEGDRRRTFSSSRTPAGKLARRLRQPAQGSGPARVPCPAQCGLRAR